MPVPNKWIYVIMLLFVIFLIWSDPGGAGTTARTFVGWLGTIFEGVFAFLDGLFGSTDSGGGTTPAEPAPVTSGSPSGIDEFNPNPELN